MTLEDRHEVVMYAQSGKNECECDRERQGALETRCSLGLHEKLQVKEEMVDPRAPSAILALYFTG